MKYLLLVALLASTAHASVLRMTVPCGTEVDVKKVLDEHGEKPMMTMKGIRMSVDSITDTTLVLYVNPTTKTYSLIETVAPNVLCAVSTGDNVSVFGGGV